MMTGPVCDRIFECDGWKKSYRQLNEAITRLKLMSDKSCTIVQFCYCPYCGKLITEEMKKSRKIG